MLTIHTARGVILKGLPVITGVLLLFSYPPYDLAPLAWFALAPLLWRILSASQVGRGTRATRPGIGNGSLVGLSLLGGLLWGVGLFYPLLLIEEGEWIQRIGGVAIIGVLMALMLGLFVAAAIRIGPALPLGRRWLAIPVFASIWVCLEYLIRAAAAGFSPYLGVTQWQVPAMLAVASVGGVYAVAWIIVAVNTSIALLTLPLVQRTIEGQAMTSFGGRQTPGRFPRYGGRPYGSAPRRRWLPLALSAATVAALWSGGYVGPPAGLEPDAAGSPLRIVLVQPHITPAEYLEARSGIPAQRRLWERVLDQVERALEKLEDGAPGSPEILVVLPETFVHYTAWDDPSFRSRFALFAREAGINWLVGLPRAVERAQGPDKSAPPSKERNAAFFIGRDGAAKAVYDKIYIIPVAEEHFAPGREIALLNLAGHRLGIGICSDVVVPDHALATVRAGATSLHYIASLAHIGGIAELERAFVALRAAEHRVQVTQTATTGPTISVDAHGRIGGHTVTGAPDEVIVDIAPRRSAPTPYTQFGDWIVLASALIVPAAAFVRAGRKRSPVG